MRQHIVRGGWFGLGVVALMLGVPGHVLAGVAAVAPEIDGSSLSAGLGVLAAGVLIVRSRMKSK
jgi:hypothetical protein